MVSIENVSFSYDEQVDILKSINLKVYPGECVLLCGASGCGKTSITKLCNGLIPHFEEGRLEGETYVAGMKVSDTPLYELSQKVGSVFQNPKSQFFNIDSDSELAFGLENSGVEPEIIRNRIKNTADELQINHLLHRNVFSMSGGEKQALAFASVYAMNPDVYILDEPSANLDEAAAERLRDEIKAVKAQGKTIIIAEHRLYYLAELIDRAVLIENGAVRREFSRDEFLTLNDSQLHALGLRSLNPPEKELKEMPDMAGDLEIRRLKVEIKKHSVFENLSFSALSGKVLGITGHNGAGKTTLLRCIAGLQKEASGEILLDGHVLKPKERNKLCYMIMQDVNHQLFGDSVWNECVLSCHGAVDESKISGALGAYDLLNFKDKHPMALSGGQKQRLAIVSGIVADRKVLMFDEPSSGPDYAHMMTVAETLRALAEDGHIVIVVTHDTELLNLSCDQVFNIDNFSQKEDHT